jgi:hypothetical protein
MPHVAVAAVATSPVAAVTARAALRHRRCRRASPGGLGKTIHNNDITTTTTTTTTRTSRALTPRVSVSTTRARIVEGGAASPSSFPCFRGATAAVVASPNRGARIAPRISYRKSVVRSSSSSNDATAYDDIRGWNGNGWNEEHNMKYEESKKRQTEYADKAKKKEDAEEDEDDMSDDDAIRGAVHVAYPVDT